MIVEIEVELKTCPFCGSDAVLKAETDFFVANVAIVDDSKIARVWAKCTNPKCAVSPVSQKDEKSAITQWNKRK